MERPTRIRDYYNNFHWRASKRKSELESERVDLMNRVVVAKRHVSQQDIDYVKENFNVDVTLYKEFENNQYDTGRFYNRIKSIYITKGNNYTLISATANLMELAQAQKDYKDCLDSIAFCDKCINLKFSKYNKFMVEFTNKIHRALIVDGYGYSFGHNIGWICVNRVKSGKNAKILDYKATKEKREEIKALGGRVWNAEDAKWCKENGVHYDATDCRVYRRDEYYLEIPMLNSLLANKHISDFQLIDARVKEFHHLSNEAIMKKLNYNIDEIINSSICLKDKLSFINKIDKTLYIKYIRNENQKSSTDWSGDRKGK